MQKEGLRRLSLQGPFAGPIPAAALSVVVYAHLVWLFGTALVTSLMFPEVFYYLESGGDGGALLRRLTWTHALFATYLALALWATWCTARPRRAACVAIGLALVLVGTLQVSVQTLKASIHSWRPDPPRAAELVGAGQDRERHGDFAGALEIYREALDLDPTSL